MCDVQDEAQCVINCFVDNAGNSEALADCLKSCFKGTKPIGIKEYLECCYSHCLSVPKFDPPGCCDNCYTAPGGSKCTKCKLNNSSGQISSPCPGGCATLS